jgi:predicted ATP-dependent serine protease
MNVGWLFLDKKEIWTKCKECGKWNKIREKADIDRFRPSPEKPAKEICQNADCRKELVIERIWFARKGMKKPKE